MRSYYAYSAAATTPTGSYDTRGTYRATNTATETDMKTAIAHALADEQGCDPTEVIVFDFTYSQIP